MFVAGVALKHVQMHGQTDSLQTVERHSSRYRPVAGLGESRWLERYLLLGKDETAMEQKSFEKQRTLGLVV